MVRYKVNPKPHFQVVWWGWNLRNWSLPMVCRWRNSMRVFFDYSILVGPLELRHWRSQEQAQRMAKQVLQ